VSVDTASTEGGIDERYHYSVTVQALEKDGDTRYVGRVQQTTRGCSGLFSESREELVEKLQERISSYAESEVPKLGNGTGKAGPVPSRVDTISVDDRAGLEISPAELAENQTGLNQFGGGGA